MVQYKISEKANKLISENEVLYYFSDDDTISLILYSKDNPSTEILVRNWTEPNTLKFEGCYSAPDKKTKKDYNWWKKSHKEFTKDKEFFWYEMGKFNNERYGNII